MTDETQTIEDAPEAEAPEVADNDEVETEEQSEAEGQSEAPKEEFPKKAINALNRKDKKINKLRAQMQELEAKLNEMQKAPEVKKVDENDFENYGDYMNAQMEALVDQRTRQTQSDMQRQMLEQQRQALKAQRDQYILEQLQEASQTLPDLPQLWQQNAQLLNALPEKIEEIFYSIDNAPAAIYTLAKEGKLDSLLYANPAIAAIEIVNAQNRGMELLSKPQQRVSQAPQPISKAKGTGSVKKQLHQLKGKEILDWVKS